MSIHSFTKGDSNALTLGTANSLTLGATNGAYLTGQTTVTGLASNAVILGTYLAAIYGNNVLWTNGTSLSMQSGDTYNFSDSQTTQASGDISLKGGLHAVDAATMAGITSAQLAIKSLLAASVGMNLAYAATLGGLDAAGDDGDNIAGSVLKAAGVAYVNYVTAEKVSKATSALSRSCALLQQVGTLKLGETGATLRANFTPEADNQLDMSPTSTTLTRTTVDNKSVLTMGLATTQFMRETAATQGSVMLTDANASFSFTGEAGETTVLLTGASASMSADETALALTGENLTATVGPSIIEMTAESVTTSCGEALAALTPEMFAVTLAGTTLGMIEDFINLDAPLIMLG
ncbi:hypothetical protein [Caballeronia sp. LZ034LL]|uniref:hypothetical protein n=1 Tax=Caballeronia sp. LZ034LL TaxID=3038567 RepID=UPI0028656844|nr:hypothetical protein [Caballeronia sp. LZ034LL]MDR5837108.1 hypothetical protein [Caballeronia sp. LZ034LL]